MKKNIFVIILLIVALLISAVVLVGCNKTEGTEETQKSTDAVTTEKPTEKPTESAPKEEEKIDESKFNVFFNQEYVCAFVIADDATETELELFEKFGTAIAGHIGKRVTLVKESELSGEYKYYIVLGNTSMQESKDAAALLGEREALAKVVGNKLIVAYKNNYAAKGILGLLEEALKKSKPLYVSLGADYSESFKAFPEISTLPKYSGLTETAIDCGEGSYMSYVDNVDASEFVNYCSDIEAAEFGQNFYREAQGNMFAQFEGADEYVYLYYTEYNKQLRIITGPIESMVHEDNNSYASEKYTPSITAVKQPNQGEGFIIRLPDGRFIVIDGGYGGEDRIYNALRNLGEKKIVVAAWFISHPHDDHYSPFIDFAKSHGKDSSVTVEQILFNFASADKHSINGSAGEDNSGESVKLIYETARTYMPDVPIREVHTGQLMHFGSASVEVLYTIEDLLPKKLPNGNDASLVIRLKVADQTAIFLNDTCYDSGPILNNLWGDHLKSDIVQVAHHGMYPANKEIYESIKAETLLIPGTKSGVKSFVADSRWTAVYDVIFTYGKDLYICSDNTSVTIELPYTVVNNKDSQLQ